MWTLGLQLPCLVSSFIACEPLMRIWLLLTLIRMWLLLLRPSRVFALAKGFRGKAKNCFRIANSQAEEALEHQVAARELSRRFLPQCTAPAAASKASQL
jgi:hypothetical protein